MRTCSCMPKIQDTAERAPARCAECHGIIVRDRPLSAAEFGHLVARARSLLDQLAHDHLSIADLAVSPVRRNGTGGRSSGVSDPTGGAVADSRRQQSRDFLALTGFFLKRALAELHKADEAMGDSVYVSDPGPAERAAGTWYPTLVRDADLDDARAAQVRRRQRGEA